MTLRLNGDSSGFTEIKAPNTAGDNSITLPTSNGGANQLLQNGGTAGALQYTSAGNGLHYDSSGRLLVGTSSDFTNGTGTKLQSVDAAGGQIALGRDIDTLNTGNLVGRLRWYGNVGGTQQETARIAVLADGNHALNDKPGRIVLSTTGDGGSSVTDRVQIGSDGALKLLDGCPGIDFSAIQTNSAGMTSETLDGYEEGTWTPSYLAASGDLSAAINQGVYVKVGSAVFFSMRLANTQASFAGVSGQVLIQGLPFTVGSSTRQRIGGASVNEAYRWGTNFSNIRAYPLHGTTAININIMASNATSYTNLDVSDMNTGLNQNIFSLSGWYTTTDF